MGEIFLDDGDIRLYQGDVEAVLAGMPDESVDCVVTSPPYWGLRDYGTGGWDGGDPECDHVQMGQGSDSQRAEMRERAERQGYHPSNAYANYGERMTRGTLRDECGKCGARRVDQQLGLEPTPDLYVQRIVSVFRQVRRVLAPHGTCWVNLGDSYATGGSAGGQSNSSAAEGEALPGFRDSRYLNQHQPRTAVGGLKVKDLVGAPWRVAFALQADGWWLRADIIWAKPNPMPESVTDRPTKAHEYIFMLTKQPRYYFDQEAVREAHKPESIEHHTRYNGMHYATEKTEAQQDAAGKMRWEHRTPNPAGRNVRSVWQIATQPYPEAHFATYPEELVRRCVLAGCPERVCRVCGKPSERIVEPTTKYDALLSKQPHKDEFDLAGFGAYLRSCREDAGMSKTDVGNALGVSSTAINWWEGGTYMGEPARRHPTWELYERLKATVGLDDRYDESLRRYRIRIEGGWKNNATDSLVEGNRKGGINATAQRETVGWSDCGHNDWRPGVTLDPFIGSGTTCKVARDHGRHSIGIDLSADYLNLAARRLQQLSLLT